MVEYLSVATTQGLYTQLFPASRHVAGCWFGPPLGHKLSWRPFGRITWRCNHITMDRTRTWIRTDPARGSNRHGGSCVAIWFVAYSVQIRNLASAGRMPMPKGGTETLVEHRVSIEPPGCVTSPAGLLHISVGLEAVEDLMQDFDRALDIAQSILCN